MDSGGSERPPTILSVGHLALGILSLRMATAALIDITCDLHIGIAPSGALLDRASPPDRAQRSASCAGLGRPPRRGRPRPPQRERAPKTQSSAMSSTTSATARSRHRPRDATEAAARPSHWTRRSWLVRPSNQTKPQVSASTTLQTGDRPADWARRTPSPGAPQNNTVSVSPIRAAVPQRFAGGSDPDRRVDRDR